jgi:hypothetical protein
MIGRTRSPGTSSKVLTLSVSQVGSIIFEILGSFMANGWREPDTAVVVCLGEQSLEVAGDKVEVHVSVSQIWQSRWANSDPAHYQKYYVSYFGCTISNLKSMLVI